LAVANFIIAINTKSVKPLLNLSFPIFLAADFSSKMWQGILA